MALNGSGSFSRLYSWATDKTNGIRVRADKMDDEFNGIATALSTAMYKDGQATPTADIPFGGYKLTGVGTPDDSTDGATKGYVDGVVSGVQRAVCRVATTANGTLASDFENGDTIDGVVLATDDVILLKDQTDASENGVYVVKASGAPDRSTDFDTWAEFVGAICSVTAGTANEDTLWVSMVNAGGTLETTDIVFAASGQSISLPLAIASGGTAATSAANAFSNLKQDATSSATGVLEIATDAEVYSATANKAITADLIESASAPVTLTDGSSPAFDWDAGINRAWTLGASRTCPNPTNGQPGTWRTVQVTQDATGTFTLAWGNQYVFPSGITPTLATGANAVSRFAIYCRTTSVFECYPSGLGLAA